MISLTIAGKKVDIFPGAAPTAPVVYLNTHDDEGTQIAAQLTATCPNLSIVAISQLAWNHDMSPWAIPPLSKKDQPCSGGADDYLTLLTTRIIPEAEKALPATPIWRGIAGYSLAGLFAVYALYQTDVFSRAASISGSLWFPDIKTYLFSHQPRRTPDCLYFSLGDKECHTRNAFLKSVQENTEAIAAFYKSQHIDTFFTLNPGNHFKDVVPRTAAGIHWIASR